MSKVDEDGDIGAAGADGGFELAEFAVDAGQVRMTSVMPMTAMSSERTMRSRPSATMRSPPMPKKVADWLLAGEAEFEGGDEQGPVMFAAGLAGRR